MLPVDALRRLVIVTPILVGSFMSAYARDGVPDKADNPVPAKQTAQSEESQWDEIVVTVITWVANSGCIFGGCKHGQKIYAQGKEYDPDKLSQKHGFDSFDDLIEETKKY